MSDDVSHPVAVKSVPPRRRTKSNMRIMKDSNLLSSSDNTSAVDNMNHVLEEADESPELLLTDVLDKASGLAWILLFCKYQKLQICLRSYFCETFYMMSCLIVKGNNYLILIVLYSFPHFCLTSSLLILLSEDSREHVDSL